MSEVTAQQTLPPRHTAQFPSSLNAEGVLQVLKTGWPFFEAGIVLKNIHGEIMLVKEVRQDADDGKWRLPCGRLRPWDDFQGAARYHGIDQTAHDFDLGNICYIGFQADVDEPCLTVFYYAGNPYLLMTDEPNPQKISAINWFSFAEIEQLAAADRLGDPDLTMAVARASRDEIVIPSGAITCRPSKFTVD